MFQRLGYGPVKGGLFRLASWGLDPPLVPPFDDSAKKPKGGGGVESRELGMCSNHPRSMGGASVPFGLWEVSLYGKTWVCVYLDWLVWPKPAVPKLGATI